jgi:hypothetical protein
MVAFDPNVLSQREKTRRICLERVRPRSDVREDDLAFRLRRSPDLDTITSDYPYLDWTNICRLILKTKADPQRGETRASGVLCLLRF